MKEVVKEKKQTDWKKISFITDCIYIPLMILVGLLSSNKYITGLDIGLAGFVLGGRLERSSKDALIRLYKIENEALRLIHNNLISQLKVRGILKKVEKDQISQKPMN